MTEILCDADQDDEKEKERGCGRRRRRGQRRRTVTCARVEPAGVVTEERARSPGAMTSCLHQEQGYGGSESRSAEKVEAAGFLLRSPIKPGSGRGSTSFLAQLFSHPRDNSLIHSIVSRCQNTSFNLSTTHSYSNLNII